MTGMASAGAVPARLLQAGPGRAGEGGLLPASTEGCLSGQPQPLPQPGREPLSPAPVPSLPAPPGLSQSVRGSTGPRHPFSPQFPGRAPHPTFLLLRVDIRRCLVSLLPARLDPPGNKALSASPAMALHLAQSGGARGCLRGE